MKIAIDISQIVHEGTGVATYTDQLVRNLLNVDHQNEYILFGISLRKFHKLQEYFSQLRKLNNNLRSCFFHIPPKLGDFVWNKLHRINIENLTDEIDIFHSSDWIQPPSRAKKITTVHDLLILEYPEVSHPYIVEVQKRRLKWVKKECDMVLTDSDFTKNQVNKILNIDYSRIEVVYPGISDKFLPASEESKKYVKQKYGLYKDFILSVGTLEPRKNIKTVLDAFEKFKRHQLISTRKRPIELVIAGKTGWGDKINKTKYIKPLGFVEEKDLPYLYSAASLFVYPSLYEGFGFPVLEAMACGCPVITSDRGSLRELTSDAAMIADPLVSEDIAVKMTQVFVDSDLRENLIQKGKKNVERFNWENTASEVLNIYKKVVSS